MGNAFSYRFPALACATLASSALALLALSGSTCSFLEIRAREGHLLYIPGATEPSLESSTSMGVLCINDIYDEILESDLMYFLSRICLFLAITMGSFTCILAWAVSTFIGPTDANWKLLSVFAAISAVLQMPIFLAFEADPCSAFWSEQECKLAVGSYFLIASTILWISVTLATQFLDPPLWASELDAWRVNHQKRNREANANSPPRGQLAQFVAEDRMSAKTNSQSPLLNRKNQPSRSKPSFMSGFQKWAERRRWARDAELAKNQTDSLSESNVSLPRYAESDNSRLVLKVLPNGKRPGDDAKSIRSFEDLESVDMEEGKSLAPPSNADEKSVRAADLDMDNTSLVVQDKQEFIKIVDTVKNISANQAMVTDILNDLKDADKQRENQGTPASKQQRASNNQTTSPPKFKQKSPLKEKKSGVAKIRNLTENLKRKATRKRQNDMYTLIDDHDLDASFLPREVVFSTNTEEEALPMAPGTPTRQAEFPCYDPESLQKMQDLPPRRLASSFDDNADEDFPDPIIAAMPSHEDDSSDGEPDPVLFCAGSSYSDDLSGDDGASTGSDSSGSDSDSSGASSARSARDLRRNRIAQRARNISASRSVVSCISLLDTTIQEETAADLAEFDSGDEGAPCELKRSMSVPNLGAWEQPRSNLKSKSEHSFSSDLSPTASPTEQAPQDEIMPPSATESHQVMLAPVMLTAGASGQLPPRSPAKAKVLVDNKKVDDSYTMLAPVIVPVASSTGIGQLPPRTPPKAPLLPTNKKVDKCSCPMKLEGSIDESQVNASPLLGSSPHNQQQPKTPEDAPDDEINISPASSLSPTPDDAPDDELQALQREPDHVEASSLDLSTSFDLSFSLDVSALLLDTPSKDTPSDVLSTPSPTVSALLLDTPSKETKCALPIIPSPNVSALLDASTSFDASMSFEAEILAWKAEREAKAKLLGDNVASPAMTAPETPSSGLPSPDSRMSMSGGEEEKGDHEGLLSSFESELSWKEEREIRGGIHAPPIDADGDLSSGEPDDETARVLNRAREARRRRIQRETDRKRSKTQDPTIGRRYVTPVKKGIVDDLDLQLIKVLRSDGEEYGFDERSL